MNYKGINMKNILGLLILPIALMIVIIIYVAAQVKYFMGVEK